MRHLSRHAPQYSLALPGRTRKFNLVSTLPVFCDGPAAASLAPESVDAPIPCLYKGADGGGCNPAAAVLWAKLKPSGILAAATGTHRNVPNTGSVDHALQAGDAPIREQDTDDTRKEFETMANTTSAKKATRKIARRTVINKSRRTEMRGAVRTVEEAIKRGDRDAALKAMARAEPELMRAAQRNIVHRNNASRKVSRLSHQIAKLAK
jgi:small subunit ribosomal protein S20